MKRIILGVAVLVLWVGQAFAACEDVPEYLVLSQLTLAEMDGGSVFVDKATCIVKQALDDEKKMAALTKWMALDPTSKPTLQVQTILDNAIRMKALKK